MGDTEELLREILAELTEMTRIMLKLESAVDSDQADLFESSNDEN